MIEEEAKAHRLAAAKFHRKMRKAAKDFSAFIKTTVKDDHGAFLKLAPIHKAWLDHVNYCWERNLKAIVLAPFGHGKSSTLAVPLIAWHLGRDPNLRIKVVTNDDAGATKRVSAAKVIIEGPRYQQIFPNVQKGDKWTDHELYLKRGGHAIDPSVQARGVLTTGIGGRADLIVFDDVVDQRNSMDPAQRRKILELVESTWLSRLEPDGKVLYIDTLWHPDDATHHLMTRAGWCTLLQRVSADCQAIEQEVFGADSDYPGLITEPVANVG